LKWMARAASSSVPLALDEHRRVVAPRRGSSGLLSALGFRPPSREPGDSSWTRRFRSRRRPSCRDLDSPAAMLARPMRKPRRLAGTRAGVDRRDRARRRCDKSVTSGSTRLITFDAVRFARLAPDVVA
jgi:hypothetical protein